MDQVVVWINLNPCSHASPTSTLDILSAPVSIPVVLISPGVVIISSGSIYLSHLHLILLDTILNYSY